MKILNLYAGIGGNRKLWGDNHEITSIEYDAEIGKLYKHFFPNDELIVTDAHEFLRQNYKNYDFIWASPPCPTHSSLAISWKTRKIPNYPEMSLYQEIIFLKHFFDGYFCVENVIPYYKPLINPSIVLGRHYFWSNFEISKKAFYDDSLQIEHQSTKSRYKFNIYSFEIEFTKKRKILRNLVNPEVAKHILDCLILEIETQENILFNGENYE